ncbi:MAG: terminase family protein, partial [Chloroflexota bacterium]
MKLGPQAGPQTAFLSSSADIAIYGGAGGAGKTFGLILETIRHLEVPDFSAVIFRREMPQIRNPGGLWDTAGPIYRQLGGRPNAQGASWRFPAGSIVKMAHLQLEDDKTSWDGAQIALICFDELQHFSESQFWYLQSRNRSTCGVRPYTRAACNPDADSWLRSLLDWWIGPDGFPVPERSGILRWFLRVGVEVQWVDGWIPEALSLTFVPAHVRDNPALLSIDPGYLSRLQALESTERARLLHGNWNAKPDIRGRIYSAFQPEKHFLSHERAKILER